jgi:hypothetical protein
MVTSFASAIKVSPKKIPLSKEVDSGGVGVNKGVKGPLRKLKGGKVRLKVNHSTGPIHKA